MAMVPHERSLVNRLEGKPFALLGVNFDKSKDELKKVEENEKINWRSFWDGSEGPIGKQWNIRFLPTIYVLDHNGVIRYKSVRDKDMDEAVDKLLKEVKPEEKK
jgi:AhpC/TSA family